MVRPRHGMDPNIDNSISEHELFERLGSKETVDLDPHINNVFHLNEFVDHPTHTIAHLPITTSIDYSDSHSLKSQVASISGVSGALKSNSTRFSQYKPGSKPRRLGRPRKHQQNLPSPSDSSTHNLKKAITSKFRFDNQPLEGPGSRGGKTIRSIPRGKIVDTKRQSTLPFGPQAINEESKEITEDKEKKNNETKNNDSEEVIVIASQPTETTEKKVEENDELELNNDEDRVNEEVKDEMNEDDEVIEETKEEAEKNKSARPKRARKPVVKEVLEEGPKKVTKKVTKKVSKVTKKKSDSKKAETNKTEKKTANGTSKKRTTPADNNSVKKSKASQASKLVSTSRTTVLNTGHKISRQLPGPLVGLFYDLYDDNVIEASQNAKAAAEKVALGYPVKKSPYASDILFIIEFLNKFDDVIGFDHIGPQDIEKGLSLPDKQESESEQTNESNESKEPESKYNPNYISSKMKRLFMKLMGLVLNRKRDVTSQSSAIMELKSISVSLGLPAEWREDTEEEKEEDIEAESPVDPSVPVDAGFTKVFSQDYKIKFNPFTSSQFEQKGLEVLEPKQRLVTLRILIQWALSTSDLIKGHITQISQKIDIPGDKETYYAARSVLKGFKNASDAKEEAEAKFQKREDDVKYIDPTSDPLDHCFRIRLHEQLAGDIGFHVGRFYLCRMANKYNGGLTSVKKMGSIWSGPAVSEPASDFKLYVQDVHSMLVQALSNEDLDQETASKGSSSTGHDNWYEVASTVQELASFVNFLSQRLGITGTNDDDVIPMTSTIYKPVMYLYGYLSGLLPLLIKQESIEAYSNKDGRSSRQRDINYSDKKYSHYFEEEEEEEEYDDDEDEYRHEDAKEHEEDEVDEEYYD